MSAEPPWPEPPAGTRIQLPILSSVGSAATGQTLIQVQNVGNNFTRAIILFWGEAGACGPQAVGPFKVECSGLIKPGATWMFSEQQVPAGAQSGILYTFPQDDIVIDDETVSIADEFCERLFADVTLNADEFRRFDMAFRQGEDFFGLPTTDGQPVAVDVVRVGQGTPSPDLTVSGAYAGLTGPEAGAYDPVYGGYTYYAPVVYANAGGLNSWLYVQNSGLDCTGVEMWYQEQNDCLRAQICEVVTLAPGETLAYNVSDCVGPSFVGSVWLRTSQPSGVVVDHIGQDVLMTDKGVAAENAITQSGSEVLFGPLIYREFQGWETSISVQNMSSTRYGSVKVYFYDESGNIITTLVDYICPRGTQTFFLPVINGLPGQYVGAVRVESLTTFSQGEFVPISAVAHLIKYSDPTATQAQEAISYNLFGEPQSFDWQQGPGNAGLIGVPSVLKQGRGLSTELAIQNINPYPGFTDFAIYLYDANGLLEVLCEKLNANNVEYINFNSWGIINPGFVGSVVISGVFTNQIPPGGNPNQNWFGLSAVAIQRVQSILQFNTPGDESSGHEAFPIFTEDFDFEGPTAPACPGVREEVCRTNVTVQVTNTGTPAGTPVPNVVVQLRGPANQPIKTGITDSNGIVTLENVPVPDPATADDPDGTDYEVWVQRSPDDTLHMVGTITNLVCPDPNNVNRITVLAAPLEWDIAGIIFDDQNGNGVPDSTESLRVGVTVVLQDDAGEEIETVETDSTGTFEFEDITQGTYHLKAVFEADAGNVSYPSPFFILDADYNTAPEQPIFDALTNTWIEPGGEDLDGPTGFDIAGTVYTEEAGGNCDADAGELRFSGVTVQLIDPGPDGAAGGGDDTLLDEAITDRNGDFRFEDLVTGEDYYLFVPNLDGGAPLTPVFTVDALYDGTLTDGAGNPEQPNFVTNADGTSGVWAEPGCGSVNGPGD